MPKQDRITRLAQQIDSVTRTARHLVLTETDVIELRRQGALELHSICADFVASVNHLLTSPVVELTPPEWAADMFRESGMNLIQINAHGRIVQIAFEATRERFSTEKFRIPYALEGEVRTYNQEMLERSLIRNQALFFCLEEDRNRWRYLDWLRAGTGVFDRDHLVNLLERLV